MLEITTCIPKKHPKKALIFQLIMFCAAIVCLYISQCDISFKWIYQLSVIVFAVLFVQSVTRHMLYEYKYILTENAFIIVQKSGKKEIQVCNLNLDTAIGIFSNEEFSEQKKKAGHIKSSYNYTQNFMPSIKYYYFFEFNGSISYIVFEPESDFVEHMKLRLSHEASL